MKQTFSLLIVTAFTILVSTGFTPINTSQNKSYSHIQTEQQLTGHWNIQAYGNDGNDLSGSLREYLFTFYEDGSIIVTNGDLETKATYMNDSQSLTFSFGDENLAGLNGRWDIKDMNEDEIALTNADGVYLVFRQVYYSGQ